MSIVVKNAVKRRKGYIYSIDGKGNLVEHKMSRSRKPYKKPLINLKEDMDLKFAKDNLEQKKRVYATYIKALVKYNIKELAYQAIMYDELNQNLLMRNLELCKDDNDKFAKLFFEDMKKLNEKERIEHNIEHYERLIKRCRGMIVDTQDKVREKIAKDAVEKSLAWLTTPELVAEIIKKKDAVQKDGE